MKENECEQKKRILSQKVKSVTSLSAGNREPHKMCISGFHIPFCAFRLLNNIRGILRDDKFFSCRGEHTRALQVRLKAPASQRTREYIPADVDNRVVLHTAQNNNEYLNTFAVIE